MFKTTSYILILLSTLFLISHSQAESKTKVNYIAIIIDDLGYKLEQDQRAIDLPGQLTFAFLPHTPHLKHLTDSVHAKGNDIMLHLPMQATMETLYLGPGALTNKMSEKQFKQSVIQSIHSIPHVKGVNNHMGSLITSQKNSMNWLMDELSNTDLYFVDSRTTVNTLAEKTANQYHIKNTRRNVFLDHELNRPAIEFQFNRLINLAKKNGSAVAIGHPFKETLDVLEEKIPQLKAEGIQLISVSALIQQQNRKRHPRQAKAAPKKAQNNWLYSQSLTRAPDPANSLNKESPQ